MKKGILLALAATMPAFISFTSSASEVTLSHSFSAGEPARADEVNQDFADIKTAVDDNHSRLSDNETAVSNHTTAISGNTAAVGALASTVDTNTETGSANAAAINAHGERITANESSIADNALAIDANTQAIGANTLSIASLNQAVSIYDRDGNRLGRFLTVAPLIDSNYSTQVHQGTVVWLLSDNGYLSNSVVA